MIGAGSVGVAWAIVFAAAGRMVNLYDPDPARRDAIGPEIAQRAEDLARAGLGGEIGDRIRVTGDLRGAVAGSGHVQECAPESLSLKRDLFAELDGLAPPSTPLASSSSFLPASAIAADLPGCARCLVAHPGNPPTLLRIVELVPASFTDPAVVDRTETLLRGVGMIPIRLRREIEGFVFNRLQGAVLREAYCLVRDGVVNAADLDRVMTEGLGPRWAVIGPFETADLNSRGGIAAHAERMGPAYARMGAERGQDDPWTADLVAGVEAERRAALPLARWDERVRWRDRVLMALVRAKKAALA